ncbi:MAG: lipid A biosynthesis acyltransferase [Pseudomonadales bacterium]|nr:lipid A biosynthesis acyltransferase [Pseudomonadales bacterium]NRA15704.1 lipid A biosynthesis acyltransferase [Oceanospirillaceae bacterium]
MNDLKNNWPALLTLSLIRALAKLPFKRGIFVGTLLGNLLRLLAVKRRRVTEVNIKLCFPNMDHKQQQQFLKDVFIANGIGIVETAWAHYGDRQMFADKIEIRGQPLLDAALAQGRGVVLVGAHFSTLDLGGLLFSFTETPLNTLYRRHNNPLLDTAITAGRSKYCQPIERKNMRLVIKKLKQNQCVWFAPDQDLNSKGCVFVEFFGQCASTITATSNLVRFNSSAILMLAHYRKPDNSGYILEFSAVPSCDSNDKAAFAQVINDSIEKAIKKQPDQYMWMHKRFKTQPDGEQKLYAAAKC